MLFINFVLVGTLVIIAVVIYNGFTVANKSTQMCVDLENSCLQIENSCLQIKSNSFAETRKATFPMPDNFNCNSFSDNPNLSQMFFFPMAKKRQYSQPQNNRIAWTKKKAAMKNYKTYPNTE